MGFNVRIMYNRTREKDNWYRKTFTSPRNWGRSCINFRSYVDKWTYLNGVINNIITTHQSILCKRVLVLEYFEIKNSWENSYVEDFLNLRLMHFRQKGNCWKKTDGINRRGKQLARETSSSYEVSSYR